MSNSFAPGDGTVHGERPPLIAIPIKAFGVAKRRLASTLDASARSRLGRAVAARSVSVAAEIGSPVAVVTSDESIAEWASGLGAEVIREVAQGGLNGAARAAVDAAHRRGLAWMVVHADLPLVTPAELAAVLGRLPRGGVALAPSHDGGTTVIAGDRYDFPFSYGPGSLRRHLAAAAHLPHALVIKPGLALDLDGPRDLQAMRGMAAGKWLETVL